MEIMAVEANVRTVREAVLVALKQDDSDNNKAAYISYLQCIRQVVYLLLQDAMSPDEIKISASTKKCVQLGHQCMERIVELVDNLQPVCPLSQQPDQNGSRGHNTQAKVKVMSGLDQPQAPINQLPELPSPTHSLQTYMRRSAEPSPMEIAQKKNQQLMLAYKTRMANISAKSHNATNISLSLQRRMAENVAIARSREEALAKKVQERQRRSEEEAARRFASTAGMSKDEQERRHIYSQVLVYEADAKYLQSWRQKLSSNPEDGKLVQDLILLIINTKDHPLAQLLNKIQYAIYDKLRPLVLSYLHELNQITLPYISSPTNEQAVGIATPKDSTSDMAAGVLGSSRSLHTSKTDLPTMITTDTGPNRPFEKAYAESKSDLAHAISENSSLCQTLQAEVKCSDEMLKKLSDVDQFEDLYDVTGDEYGATASSTDVATASEAGRGTTDLDLCLKDLDGVTEEDKLKNLKMDAFLKHMEYISSDVRDGMEKLCAMFIIAYEALDSAAGRDLCLSSLEGPFFEPLWPYLLALYRLGSHREEVAAARAMTRLADVTPGDLGVKKHFWPPASCPGTPFQSCVDVLTRLTQLSSPLLKLESTVRLCKLLCQIMEENSAVSQTGSPQARQTTGADDLLPVLSYVVIRSRLPQLVAECRAMEEFIHEGYLMGEEGYCLTSLQTSLNYIINMATPPASTATSHSDVTGLSGSQV